MISIFYRISHLWILALLISMASVDAQATDLGDNNKNGEQSFSVSSDSLICLNVAARKARKYFGNEYILFTREFPAYCVISVGHFDQEQRLPVTYKGLYLKIQKKNGKILEFRTTK